MISIVLSIRFVSIFVYNNKYFPSTEFNLVSDLCKNGNKTSTSLINFGLSKKQNILRDTLGIVVVFLILSVLHFLNYFYKNCDQKLQRNTRLKNPEIFANIRYNKYESSQFSKLFDMGANTIAYFSLDIVLLTGILSIILHIDILAILHIIFLFLLIYFSININQYSENSLQDIRYKCFIYIDCYFVFISINLRYILYVAKEFLSCIALNYIHHEELAGFLNQILFLQPVLEVNKKYLLVDFLHFYALCIHFYKFDDKDENLFVIPYFCRDDFTGCKTIMDILKYLFFSHSIHLCSLSVYLISFSRICGFNFIYIILCIWLIYHEQNLLQKKSYRRNFKYFQLIPLLLIFIKIFHYFLSCVDKPLVHIPSIIPNLLFDLNCPINGLNFIKTCYIDIAILVIFVIELQVLLSANFDHSIVENYISVKISDKIRNLIVNDERMKYNKCHQLGEREKWIKILYQLFEEKISINFFLQSTNQYLYQINSSIIKDFYKSYKIIKETFPCDASLEISTSFRTYLSNSDKKIIHMAVWKYFEYLINYFKYFLTYYKKYYMRRKDFRKNIKDIVIKFKKDHIKTLNTLKNFHLKDNLSIDISNIIEDAHISVLEESSKPSLKAEYINQLENSLNKYTDQRLDEFNEHPEVLIPLYEASFSESVDNNKEKTENYTKIFCEVFANIYLNCTDFLLYFALIINVCYSASVVSLVQPFSYLLYACCLKNGAPCAYWNILQIYTLIISCLRYFLSIKPLYSFFTCDSNCRHIPFNVGFDTPLCIYRILGIDGCHYSHYAEFFVLIAIKLHVISLKHQWNLFDDKKMPKAISRSLNKTNYFKIFREKIQILSAKIKIWAFDKSISQTYQMNIRNDYYGIVFLSQVASLVIISCYWNSFFAPTIISGNIAKIISGSIVPLNFVILITIQTLFILIDRGLNISRNRNYKSAYTVFLIILIHSWLFFIVPYITNKKFYDNTPVVCFYICYCVYFYFSYISIRNGYCGINISPYIEISKFPYFLSFLTFKLIIIIPFVLEIDSILRWMFSKTVLNIFQFIKVDDIYMNIQILQIMRKNSKEHSEEQGKEYSYSMKIFISIFAVGTILSFILFPLWFFSPGLTNFISVLPSQIDLSISINGYYPIYESTVIRSAFQIIRNTDEIRELFESVPENQHHYANSLLYEYLTTGDILKIDFSRASFSSWFISPPAREILIEEISKNISSFLFRLKFKIIRESSDMMNVIGLDRCDGSFIINITNNQINSSFMQKRLLEILHGKVTSSIINNFLPYLIRVESSKPMYEYLTEIYGHNKKSVCAFHRNLTNSFGKFDDWWEFTAFDEGKIYNQNDKPDCDEFTSRVENMKVYFFIDFLQRNEKKIIGSTSAVALYFFILGSLSSFIKRVFTSTSRDIIYSEWPDSDFMLSLCHCIYRARSLGNLKNEEFFVSMLMFLYRSPKDLIYVTRENAIV